MVHTPADGDLGVMATVQDLDQDGLREVTGGEVGFGVGTVSAGLSDADKDGQTALDVGGALGPVSIDSSSESGASFLNAAWGLASSTASNLAEGAKSAWSGLTGLFGKR
jgi:hypothetical protein